MQPSESSDFGIPRSNAVTAADFFESYARSVAVELESYDRDVRSNRRGRAPEDDEYRWRLLLDSATAFRQAGQWALLFDLDRSSRLLQRAGEVFRELGHAFGLFVLAATGPKIDSFELRQDMRMLLRLHDPNLQESGSVDIPSAMYHPQQQAYLLVTLSALPLASERYSGELRSVCTESPHRVGGTPAGAVGLPIRHYWQVALSFLDGRPDQIVSENLVPLIGRYTENIDSAAANSYLWVHGAAPVDVADMDAIGITALAVRRFGSERVISAVADQVKGIPPVGLKLISIGIRLGMRQERRRWI
jgi:hypothetical protein